MFYAFILLGLLSFSAQAMKEEEKVVTLWAIHEVILRPCTDGLMLPESLSAKSFEHDLLDSVRYNTNYQNELAAKHPGKLLPLGFKAWLLDLESGESMEKVAKIGMPQVIGNKSWYMGPIIRLILPNVIETAFNPKKTASYLKPIAGVVALAKSCQQNGSKIALASNWNSENFGEIEKQHPIVVELFKDRYTSGKLKKLTMDPAYFEKIQDAMGGGRRYYYIDIEEGQESLDAAREAGVTPISVIVADDKEKAADLELKLMKHGLITE
jgi:hypothetical protein